MNGVARKISTKRVMSSSECIRPPTETTLASLCSRASAAVSSDQARAERTPRTLLAAICSPLPGAADDHAERLDPGLLVGDHARGRAQAEDGVVVERVVDEGAVVDGLVAVLGEPGEEVGLELEPGVVGADVHAHARSL